MAISIKMKKAKNKVYCFVGDMTSETGIMSESLKYAENHKLPIHFVVEDNSLSVCTDTKKVWGLKKLSNQNKKNKYITYYKYKLKYPHAGAGKKGSILMRYFNELKKSMEYLAKNKKTFLLDKL